MENKKRRITITIPLDRKDEIEELKRERYKEESRSEMFRNLMKEGLKDSAKQDSETGNVK